MADPPLATPAPATPAPHIKARFVETPQPRAQRAFEGCLYAHEQTACRRAFEAVIERQGGFTMAVAGDRLGSQRMSMMTSLTFDEAPQWQRRIEAVAEDGIPFKRLRRGNDHELLIGISRDGVLGFTLAERPSGR